MMSSHVRIEIALFGTFKVTVRALMRLLTSMSINMFLQCNLLRSSEGAKCTSIWSFTSVNSYMRLEVADTSTNFTTIGTS